MAAGLRFLRAKRRAKTVDFAQRHRVRFIVKLARLRKIKRLFIEVIHFKKRTGSFASGRREYRRIDQREALIIEVVANGFNDFMAHTKDRRLPS